MTLNILEYDSAYQNKIIVKMNICPEMQCYLPSRQFCFLLIIHFYLKKRLQCLKKFFLFSSCYFQNGSYNTKFVEYFYENSKNNAHMTILF